MCSLPTSRVHTSPSNVVTIAERRTKALAMIANRLLTRSLFRHAAGCVVRHQTSRMVASSLVSNIRRPTLLTFSSSSQQLSDLLARELDEEEENAAMPPELQQLLDELKSDWRIVDDESNGTVKLFRQSGKVALNFHCQESLPVEFDEDDDDEEASAPVRFTVTTSKAGKTLVMWCLSEEGAASVEGLAVTTADSDSIFANGIAASSYQGPEFSELPEDVQDAFTDFLHTECGVSSDVAAFIAMYADYKEQAQYCAFLKQVQSIV